ncbi:MAG TPA: DUF192 domain-containing protein [Ruminiclostridium sp.]|nr:DUF192 domain-containing protein [Ruminiclostridium sp.]
MLPHGRFRYLAPYGKEIPVNTAGSFKSRFLGLMGRKEGYYGLLIYPCNSIHTCFMRFTMDAIYLDSQDTVVAIKRFIKPFRFTMPVHGAVKILEFPSSLNASAFLSEGAQINLYYIDN